MGRQRNDTLEIIKLFASYMVVLIHFFFRDGLGGFMDALARFAVPLFFIISGFYSYKISLNKIKSRIKNIAVLTLFATLVYTAFNVAALFASNNVSMISTYFEKYLDPKALVHLFVFNIPLSSEHLWFLFALIYVYIVFYITTKYKISDTWVLGTSVLFLLAHILAGEVALAIGIDFPAFIVRNFLFMGIPFFGFGLIAKKYEEKLLKAPNFIIWAMLLLGVLETYFSRKGIGKNELYIGSVLICFSIIVFFIKYSDVKYPRIIIEISKCNTYIYILHLLVIRVVKVVCRELGLNPLPVVSYLLVCVLSTILAYCIIIINNKLKAKFKN